MDIRNALLTKLHNSSFNELREIILETAREVFNS